MKIRFLLGVCLCATLDAPAQTAEEWLQQKETGKKYLLEQIAALRVYGNYVKKGYALAGKGWHIIQGIKQGDRQVHRDFFASLSAVNPKVGAAPFVAGTITLQGRLAGQITAIRHHLDFSRELTDPEITFCGVVLDGVLQRSYHFLEELLLLTTANQLALRDEERLQRLEHLYAQMQELYGTVSSFGADIKLLNARRRREKMDIQQVKKAIGFIENNK